MVTRLLMALAGIVGLVGIAYALLSLFAVRSVENGISRHVIDGTGITRGIILLLVAGGLTLIAFAVRPAH